MVHAQDPNHPTVTVIAGADGNVLYIATVAPGIDVIGINNYGGVTGVGGRRVASWRALYGHRMGPNGTALGSSSDLVGRPARANQRR
ncbi:MAG: hypothetical protein U0165_20540 [Polyangiaceae bacterium]